MKKIYYILKENYKIDCSFIDEYEDRYFICDKNNNYYYFYCVTNIKELKEKYILSLNNNYNYKFVYNIFNKIITKYYSFNYVLIKIFENVFFDINNLILNSINKYIKLEWRQHWIFRVNYIEHVYLQNRYVYSFIDDSIDFYISMAEFSIFYLSDYNNYVANAFIQHKRINDEYFNPFNLIVDVKERDFSEYLKCIFLNYSYKNIDIKRILNEKKDYNYNLIIARLFFPNYYFDLFEDVIDGRINQLEIKEFIYRIPEFLEYIEIIISEVSKFFPIKKIPFLKY